MTQKEQVAFFDTIRKRELAELDLNGLVEKAKQRATVSPEFAMILTYFAKEIGELCWDAGFWAGSGAGLEVAQEINSGRWK